MHWKKTALFVAGSNLLWLAVFAAVIAFTQTAQAAPAAATAAGPYYLIVSSADFQAYDDVNHAFIRNPFALYRAGTNPMSALAGTQFPPNATLTEMLIEVDDGTASAQIEALLVSCAIGGSCSVRGSVSSNNTGRHTKAVPLDVAVNNASEAYFAQANFSGSGDVGLYVVRFTYTLPAPLYLPAVQR